MDISSSCWSSWIILINIPSVTTSTFVFSPHLTSPLIRYPTVLPNSSPSVCAILVATCFTARRLGSSTIIFPFEKAGFLFRLIGITVDFPAPGGAVRTTLFVLANLAVSSSITSNMGKFLSKII